jgi:hypothetical protein
MRVKRAQGVLPTEGKMLHLPGVGGTGRGPGERELDLWGNLNWGLAKLGELELGQEDCQPRRSS